MSRHLWTIGVLALGWTVALQGQTPTGRDANRATPGAITLTGCVERADQVSAAVTAGTTVDSLSFVLIKATKGAAADSRTTGTSGARPTSEKDGTYRLDADLSTLNPHVGHRVEVTGTLATTSPTAAVSGDPSSSSDVPRLKVDRIQMLSETCGR